MVGDKTGQFFWDLMLAVDARKQGRVARHRFLDDEVSAAAVYAARRYLAGAITFHTAKLFFEALHDEILLRLSLGG